MRRTKKPEITQEGGEVLAHTERAKGWIEGHPKFKDGTIRRTPKGCETLERLLGEKKIQRASSFTAKPRPMRKRAKLKPGEESQVALFKRIIAERGAFSEVSGDPLFELPDDPSEAEFRHWVSQFSHILNKGHHRAFKKREDNIILKTPEEHALWELHKERVVDHCEPHLRHAWKWVVGIHERLKQEADGIR